MKGAALIFYFPFLIVVLLSCDLNENAVATGRVDLYFDSDTVSFDTLLTARTSISKRLRIRNPNDEAVNLDVSLAGGNSSRFGIIVNGKEESRISNVLVGAGDSLLIVVNVLIDPADESLPYLVKDSILFTWNNRTHDVKLRAWGQDAIYLEKGSLCDSVWSKGKPYVILDTLLVQPDCHLQIDEGARIFLDQNAALFIQGKLTVLGDSLDPVVFRNIRSDPSFVVAPGQWDAIYFLEGSTDNYMSYTIIENGRIGLRLGTPDEDSVPDLILEQVIIRHMSESGIQAYSSDLSATNLLIYDVGLHALFNVIGGNYDYNFCTLVNSPSSFFNDDPIVQVADYLPVSESEVIVGALRFVMKNSVIWGQSESSVFFEEVGSGNDFALNNCVIRTAQTIEGNITSLESDYPGFSNVSEFDFSPDSTSVLIDRASEILTVDALGQPRDSVSDIGALEFQKSRL